MKNKSKVSLLSILVVFAFALSGCFIDDTKWPGFSAGGGDTVTEPGPEEDPDGGNDGDGEPDHTHIYSEWRYDEVYHWRICIICGESEPGSIEIHNLTSAITDPTCTDDGYTTYTCEECGYSYKGNETDALGHIWGNWTDNNNDETHIRTCSKCHGTETQEHNYKVTDVYDITINDLEKDDITATYDYICTVCGHEMTAEKQPYTLNFANDPWEIIDEVSTAGYASTYYNVGDTKTITITDENNSEEVYPNHEEEHEVRIIDFDHDKLSPDDGGDEGNGGDDDDDDNDERKTAGMTIEMVDCLSTEYQLNSSGSYTSWESCSLKTTLDETIFSSLPEELQEVIKGVQKKTNGGYNNSSVSDSENNKLFLPAIAEIYSETGISNTSDNSSDLTYNKDTYLQEGKQYAYYKGLIGDQDPKLNCEALEKAVPGKDEGDVKNGYWVRSPNSNSASYVWRFGYRDDEGHGYCMYNDAGPNVERGVSFMFCV